MSALTEIIRAEIAGRGAIPFARFMELALYCPDYGYYERESVTVGRHGDFYTSVSVGSLFGELLALQFAEWLEKIPNDRVQIVEAGAHDGKLALDIMRWLKRWRPEVFARVEYVLVEPSSRRRAWQEKTLGELAGKVRWLNSSKLNGNEKIRGIIFANELLDAMPVHRLGWDAKKREWFEWGVALKAERFDWVKMRRSVGLNLNSEEDSTGGTRDNGERTGWSRHWKGAGYPSFNWPSASVSVSSVPSCSSVSEFGLKKLGSLPGELLEVLPDGFTTEICPAAEDWWSSAAQSLKAGKLMTLDYGAHNEAGLSPNHPNGTVRAYHRHKICDDILANAGKQDITVNVDFQAIQQVGEAMGLRTEAFVSQSQFLTGIASRLMAGGNESGEWSPKKSRELQTLIHPEHLGRAFRVLVQSR